MRKVRIDDSLVRSEQTQFMHPRSRHYEAIGGIAQDRRQRRCLPGDLDSQWQSLQRRAGLQHFKNRIHAMRELRQTAMR